MKSHTIRSGASTTWLTPSTRSDQPVVVSAAASTSDPSTPERLSSSTNGVPANASARTRFRSSSFSKLCVITAAVRPVPRSAITFARRPFPVPGVGELIANPGTGPSMA